MNILRNRELLHTQPYFYSSLLYGKEQNASNAGLQLNLAIGFSETLLWW